MIVSGEKITARGAGGAPGSSTFYAKLQSALNLPSLVVHDVESEGVKGEGLRRSRDQGIKSQNVGLLAL